MESRTAHPVHGLIYLLVAVLPQAALPQSAPPGATLPPAAPPAAPTDRGKQPIEFHVPGGPATSTLGEFGRQSDLQLLYNYLTVKDCITPPVDGIYTSAEALRRLLADSNLDFDFVNSRTLAITRIEPPSAPPQLAAKSKPTLPPRKQAPKPPEDATESVVRVTGTYLHSEPPLGQEIIIADREAMAQTGAATVADYLSTLPQIFGGGPNQDTFIGKEAQTNSGLGVGANLRGLGARATLVLIDGRRVAPSGTEGEFVDVENIPMVAVERTEILPDNASAAYGADAVGGVVNFILRERLDGAETIARGGSGTRGDLQEYLLSQALGTAWDSGNGLLALEFYDRGGLSAADRRYATSDLTSLGGGNFNTYYTNPGNMLTATTTYAIPSGQDGTHLTAADLVAGTANRHDIYTGDIIPAQRRWSFYGHGRQELGGLANVFADLLLGHREATETSSGLGLTLAVPSTNAFYVNPTGGTDPVIVAYNFGADLGAQRARVGIDILDTKVGFAFDAGSGWSINSYASYVREKQNYVLTDQLNAVALVRALAQADPTQAFNPFGDGSHTNPAVLAAIRSNYSLWLDSQLQTINLTADGPIAQVPGGPVRLALGAEHLRQEFTTYHSQALTTPAAGADLSRRIASVFAELALPIVGQDNALPGLERFDVSAAARFENYTTFGNSTTPKLGLAWVPFDSVALRGTWSQATRPPTLTDLDTGQNQVSIYSLPDPGARRGVTTALLQQGGNADVHPERARSWTAGVDFTPTPLPGLTIGLTYFDTKFTDRIQSTSLVATVLSDPRYAAIVTRNPSAAEIAYLCSHSTVVMATAAECASLPVGAIVDLRVRNLARLDTRGLDFNSRFERPLPLGKLTFKVNGTWLRQFSQALTPASPLVPLLDTQNEPISFRARASAGWDDARGFGALVAANFTNHYRDVATVPQREVASWTTIDAQLRYDVPDGAYRLFHGVRIELDMRNLFNVDPPFLNNQVTLIGYDQENANPYGRLLSLGFRKSW